MGNVNPQVPPLTTVAPSTIKTGKLSSEAGSPSDRRTMGPEIVHDLEGSVFDIGGFFRDVWNSMFSAEIRPRRAEATPPEDDMFADIDEVNPVFHHISLIADEYFGDQEHSEEFHDLIQGMRVPEARIVDTAVDIARGTALMAVGSVHRGMSAILNSRGAKALTKRFLGKTPSRLSKVYGFAANAGFMYSLIVSGNDELFLAYAATEIIGTAIRTFTDSTGRPNFYLNLANKTAMTGREVVSAWRRLPIHNVIYVKPNHDGNVLQAVGCEDVPYVQPGERSMDEKVPVGNMCWSGVMTKRGLDEWVKKQDETWSVVQFPAYLEPPPPQRLALPAPGDEESAPPPPPPTEPEVPFPPTAPSEIAGGPVFEIGDTSKTSTLEFVLAAPHFSALLFDGGSQRWGIRLVQETLKQAKHDYPEYQDTLTTCTQKLSFMDSVLEQVNAIHHKDGEYFPKDGTVPEGYSVQERDDFLEKMKSNYKLRTGKSDASNRYRLGYTNMGESVDTFTKIQTPEFRKLITDIHQQVSQAKTGEIVWLPTGFRGESPHAQAFGIVKKDGKMKVVIVNTGGGIELHKMFDDLFQDTRSMAMERELDPEELDYFVTTMFMPLLGLIDAFTNDSMYSPATVLYTLFLDGTQKVSGNDESENPLLGITEQTGGNCWVASIEEGVMKYTLVTQHGEQGLELYKDIMRDFETKFQKQVYSTNKHGDDKEWPVVIDRLTTTAYITRLQLDYAEGHMTKQEMIERFEAHMSQFPRSVQPNPHVFPVNQRAEKRDQDAHKRERKLEVSTEAFDPAQMEDVTEAQPAYQQHLDELQFEGAEHALRWVKNNDKFNFVDKVKVLVRRIGGVERDIWTQKYEHLDTMVHHLSDINSRLMDGLYETLSRSSAGEIPSIGIEQYNHKFRNFSEKYACSYILAAITAKLFFENPDYKDILKDIGLSTEFNKFEKIPLQDLIRNLQLTDPDLAEQVEEASRYFEVLNQRKYKLFDFGTFDQSLSKVPLSEFRKRGDYILQQRLFPSETESDIDERITKNDIDIPILLQYSRFRSAWQQVREVYFYDAMHISQGWPITIDMEGGKRVVFIRIPYFGGSSIEPYQFGEVAPPNMQMRTENEQEFEPSFPPSVAREVKRKPVLKDQIKRIQDTALYEETQFESLVTLIEDSPHWLTQPALRQIMESQLFELGYSREIKSQEKTSTVKMAMERKGRLGNIPIQAAHPSGSSQLKKALHQSPETVIRLIKVLEDTLSRLIPFPEGDSSVVELTRWLSTIMVFANKQNVLQDEFRDTVHKLSQLAIASSHNLEPETAAGIAIELMRAAATSTYIPTTQDFYDQLAVIQQFWQSDIKIPGTRERLNNILQEMGSKLIQLEPSALQPILNTMSRRFFGYEGQWERIPGETIAFRSNQYQMDLLSGDMYIHGKPAYLTSDIRNEVDFEHLDEEFGPLSIAILDFKKDDKGRHIVVTQDAVYRVGDDRVAKVQLTMSMFGQPLKAIFTGKDFKEHPEAYSDMLQFFSHRNAGFTYHEFEITDLETQRDHRIIQSVQSVMRPGEKVRLYLPAKHMKEKGFPVMVSVEDELYKVNDEGQFDRDDILHRVPKELSNKRTLSESQNNGNGMFLTNREWFNPFDGLHYTIDQETQRYHSKNYAGYYLNEEPQLRTPHLNDLLENVNVFTVLHDELGNEKVVIHAKSLQGRAVLDGHVSSKSSYTLSQLPLETITLTFNRYGEPQLEPHERMFYIKLLLMNRNWVEAKKQMGILSQDYPRYDDKTLRWMKEYDQDESILRLYDPNSIAVRLYMNWMMLQNDPGRDFGKINGKITAMYLPGIDEVVRTYFKLIEAIPKELKLTRSQVEDLMDWTGVSLPLRTHPSFQTKEESCVPASDPLRCSPNDYYRLKPTLPLPEVPEQHQYFSTAKGYFSEVPNPEFRSAPFPSAVQGIESPYYRDLMEKYHESYDLYQEETQKVLRCDATPEQLTTFLSHHHEEVSVRTKAIEEEMLEITSRYPALSELEGHALVRAMAVERDPRNNPTLLDILRVYRHGNPEKYKEINPTLSRADIERLDELGTEFLVKDHLRKRIEKVQQMEVGTHPEQVREYHQTLTAGRQYELTNPNVRKFIFFEWAKGFSLGKRQHDFVRTCIEDENRVVQAGTGLGKTTSLPLITDVLEGGIVIVKPALLDHTLASMREYYHVLGVEVRTFRYNEGKNVQRTLDKVKEAVELGYPLVTTLDEILSVRNAAIFNPGSVEWELWNELMKVKAIADEYESVFSPLQSTRTVAGKKIPMNENVWDATYRILDLLEDDTDLQRIIHEHEMSDLFKYDQDHPGLFLELDNEFFKTQLKPLIMEKLLQEFKDEYSFIASTDMINLTRQYWADNPDDPGSLQGITTFIMQKRDLVLERLQTEKAKAKFSEKIQELMDLIVIYKTLINDGFPVAVKEMQGRSYGHRDTIDARPKEESRFLGPKIRFRSSVMTAVLSAVDHRVTGLSQDESYKFLQAMKQQHVFEQETGATEQTTTQRLVEEWFGESVFADWSTVDIENEAVKSQWHERVKRHRNATTYFMKTQSHLHEFAEEAASNSNHLKMPIVGGSGTTGPIPVQVDQDIQFNQAGQFLSMLGKPQNKEVGVLAGTSKEAVLNELVQAYREGRQVHLFAHDYLKGDVRDIANKLFDILDPEELENVVFVPNDGSSEEVISSMSRSNREVRRYTDTIQATDKTIMILYPQHTRGIDPKLGDGVKGDLYLTNNDPTQAAGRLRRLNYGVPDGTFGHSVRIMLPESTANAVKEDLDKSTVEAQDYMMWFLSQVEEKEKTEVKNYELAVDATQQDIMSQKRAQKKDATDLLQKSTGSIRQLDYVSERTSMHEHFEKQSRGATEDLTHLSHLKDVITHDHRLPEEIVAPAERGTHVSMETARVMHFEDEEGTEKQTQRQQQVNKESTNVLEGREITREVSWDPELLTQEDWSEHFYTLPQLFGEHATLWEELDIQVSKQYVRTSHKKGQPEGDTANPMADMKVDKTSRNIVVINGRVAYVTDFESAFIYRGTDSDDIYVASTSIYPPGQELKVAVLKCLMGDFEKLTKAERIALVSHMQDSDTSLWLDWIMKRAAQVDKVTELMDTRWYRYLTDGKLPQALKPRQPHMKWNIADMVLADSPGPDPYRKQMVTLNRLFPDFAGLFDNSIKISRNFLIKTVPPGQDFRSLYKTSDPRVLLTTLDPDNPTRNVVTYGDDVHLVSRKESSWLRDTIMGCPESTNNVGITSTKAHHTFKAQTQSAQMPERMDFKMAVMKCFLGDFELTAEEQHSFLDHIESNNKERWISWLQQRAAQINKSDLLMDQVWFSAL